MIQILGRELNVLILQNMGNGSYGQTLEVSQFIEDIGNVSFELDAEITKASMGSCSIKMFDDSAETVWTFIQNSLAIGDGLLPPFILLALDGVVEFYGVCDPKNLTRQISGTEYSIQIAAQEWFSMAGRKELTGSFWTRPDPVLPLPRPASTTKVGTSPEKSLLFFSYAGGNVGQVADKVYFPTPNNWFQVGDKFTCAEQSGTFVCSAIREWTDEAYGTGTWIEATLQGFKWPQPAGTFWDWIIGSNRNLHFTYSFTRESAETTQQTYYNVTAAVPASEELTPQYVITLDTVDGLVPGDKLDLRADASRKNGTTVEINDIDSELLQVVIKDPLDVAILIGDRFYLNPESKSQLVFENMKDVVSKAMADFAGVDFSRFQPATFSVPALSWVPLRVDGTGGSRLVSPCDLQTNLTGLDLKGPGSLAWTGTPDTGWTPSTWTPQVIWTNQLTSPPVRLMPDETITFAPRRSPRNRTLMEWKRRDIDPADPTENGTTLVNVTYDYSAFRRWVLSRTGTAITVQNATWNGSVWTNGSAQTWTGAVPLDIVPFPSVASSLGSGASLLTIDDTSYLRVKFGTTTPTPLLLPVGLHTSRLVQTPFGVYLVNKTGYGKVSVQTGALTLDWIELKRDQERGQNLNLIPSTFCAMSSTDLFVMAGTTYTDPSDLRVRSETWMFQLDPTPSVLDQDGAVLQFEKIFDGVPRLSITVKDPSANRIIGLLGGRIFQVCNSMTETIERYSAEGLTALQLIENVCMVQNCMAVPLPSGVLNIVSRQITEAPLDLTVDLISKGQIKLSDYFFSQVNVGGLDETIYAYTTGQRGGKTFEMDNPFITTTSQARAVSLIYMDFFGKMRRVETQEWTHSQGGVAPWETLKPMQKITINGDAKEWFVLSLSHSLKDYSATVKLLEVV